MIKAVLWDLDGTLIDSEAIHYRAIIEANNKIGLILEENFVLEPGLEGESVFDTLCAKAQYPHRNNYATWYQYTIDYATSRINEAQLIEQNIAWVQKLAKYDIVQAIVSNSDLQFVNKALEIMALEEHIQCICSRDKVSKGKPDPALYNYALRVLNIDSTDAITIEDSNSGISAAKRANILTLAYNNSNYLADYRLDDNERGRERLFRYLFPNPS